MVDSRLHFQGRLPSDTETHLFRIAQEALTNVARHADASRVDLCLEDLGSWLRLIISDDGRGLSADADQRGFGLIGMRERILSVGGTFDVGSNGRGVRVIAEVPIDGTTEATKDPTALGG